MCYFPTKTNQDVPVTAIKKGKQAEAKGTDGMAWLDKSVSQSAIKTRSFVYYSEQKCAGIERGQLLLYQYYVSEEF